MKKFNYIDVIIVIVVAIIAVVGAVTVMTLRDEKGGAGLKSDMDGLKTIKYEVLFEEIEDYLTDELKAQKEVYAVDANEYIGKVVDVRIEPYTETDVNLTTGEVYSLEKPESYNCYLTIEADGTILNNGSFKIGDAELYPTKELNLCGQHFCSKAKIWNIIEVK